MCLFFVRIADPLVHELIVYVLRRLRKQLGEIEGSSPLPNFSAIQTLASSQIYAYLLHTTLCSHVVLL